MAQRYIFKNDLLLFRYLILCLRYFEDKYKLLLKCRLVWDQTFDFSFKYIMIL